MNIYFLRRLYIALLINSVFIFAATAGVLSNSLLSLQQEYRQYQTSQPGRPFVSKNKTIQIVNHTGVVIELIAESADDPTLQVKLHTIGATYVAQYGKVISAIVPIDRLQELANTGNVSIVHASKPLAKTSGLNGGLVYNQADAAMFSDVVRKRYDIDGSGIKIGVLSDSYNCLEGELLDILSGDLPGDVEILEELPDCLTGTDEGRAMMQLIHDIAPGAKLAFHTAFTGRAGFAEGIIKLADAGAQVIVDDVGYADELMFQDGIIAQAIGSVKNSGVAYFSAAGNSARLSYESVFNEGLDPLSGDSAHNFGSAEIPDFYQKITIPEDMLFRLSFQWDDPAESAGGFAARSDLDIFLLDASKRRVLATALGNNIGHDPVEFLGFFNDPELEFGTEFNLYISHRAGPKPGYIKYVFFGGAPAPWPEDLPDELPEGPIAMSIDEHATHSGTIFGHPTATGAMAIGAIYYQQTPWFNQSLVSAKIESFSSAGGTPTFFDRNGNRKTSPEIRKKPDVTAPDGTNNTFFPQLEDEDEADIDSDGWPNFSGTSAAAPHAAALAALVKSSPSGAHLTPDKLYQTFRLGTLDLNDPATQDIDNGFDFGTGFGLLQGDLVFNMIGQISDGVNLSISTSKAPVKGGEKFSYRLSVVNQSDKRLLNTRIRAIQLPRIVIHGITGCLRINRQEVSCSIPDLDVGEIYSITLAASAASDVVDGVLTFTADVLTDTNVDLNEAFDSNVTQLLIVTGDFNHDGCVDQTDWGMMFAVFRSGSGAQTEFDLTGDGNVSLDDLAVLETYYSNPGGVSCF